MGSKVVRQARVSHQAAIDPTRVVEDFALFDKQTGEINIFEAQEAIITGLIEDLAALTLRVEALEP